MSHDKPKRTSGLLSAHLAVLLFGMAGLFGKLILLPALLIVFGRVLFASLGLGGILAIKKKSDFRTDGNFIQLLLIGLLLAFHWFSFFYAIQLSTVALGLLTFSSFPLFTAFLEPIFYKEKFDYKFLVLALIAGFGLYLVIPEFRIDSNMTIGAIWGLLSGLSFAVLSIQNKKLSGRISTLKLTFYQDLFAAIILLPFIFFIDFKLEVSHILYLLLLGTVFTALAHYLFILSLKSIKVRTASLVSILEPVYGIFFAALLLSEIPSTRIIIGGAILLGVAAYTTAILKK